MSLVMRQALEDAVMDLSSKDSLWLQIWSETIMKIKKCQFEQWLVDAVMDPVKTEFEDAHAFLLVRGEITQGKVAYTKIHAGGRAYMNHEVVPIQRALDSLPAPFLGVFNPEVGLDHGWDDGSFSWCAPVRMNLYQNGQCTEIEVPAGNVPLEVGTTCSSKTFEHVFLGKGVARWSYSSEWIILLKRVVHDHKVMF